MIRESATELVRDPVSHISIAGIHGREELEDRIARLRGSRPVPGPALAALVLGAAVGAAFAYLLKRD